MTVSQTDSEVAEAIGSSFLYSVATPYVFFAV